MQVVDLADCSTSDVVPFLPPVDPGPPVSATALRQWATNDHVLSSAPVGITWTGDSLLVSHSAGGGILTYVTQDGDLLESIDPSAHHEFTAPSDLAWLGPEGFWVNDSATDEDWFIAPDGTLIDWRPRPEGVSDYRISYTWDGAQLWGAGQDSDVESTVFSLDEAGVVVTSFESGVDLHGIVWDGEWLWGITFASRELVRMSPDGTDITRVSVDGLPGNPRGLGWDGERFWTTINTGFTDYVVEVEVTY